MSRDILLRYPLFAAIEEDQLDDWIKSGSQLSYTTGETVFPSGSPAVWAYVVLDGAIRVLRPRDGDREVSLGTLRTGDVFGEYGFLPPHRNTVTCRATAHSRLLRLPLAPLEPMLRALPGMQERLKDWLRLHSLLSYLRGRCFLGFMSAPSALKFLDSLRPVNFQPMRTIQTDGLGSDCWYVIESGKVRLHAGENTRELGAGECFGERALLGRRGLPLAIAATEVRCLCLQRSAFAPEKAHLSLGQTFAASLSQSRSPFPWVPQRQEADCGVAALAMLAQCHGLKTSMDELRCKMEISQHGLALADLQHSGEALGLACQTLLVDPDDFLRIEPPAIVHLRSGHYVVMYAHDDTGVLVGDPASAISRITWDYLRGNASGNILLASPHT